MSAEGFLVEDCNDAVKSRSTRICASICAVAYFLFFQIEVSIRYGKNIFYMKERRVYDTDLEPL